MKEIWKRLIYHGEDLGDWYEVSNLGNIRNAKNHRIRKLNALQQGYYFVGVSLGNRNVKPCIKVHRAVAETFIPNPKNLPVINHIDGNKLNNNVENLEWCTHKHNIHHAIEHGLHHPGKYNRHGYHHKHSKLTEEDFEYIKQVYKPFDKEFGSRALGRKFNVSHSAIVKAYYYQKDK